MTLPENLDPLLDIEPMELNSHRTIQRFAKGRLHTTERSVVEEYPLRLTVNERELATLIASPHQLNFLVAGFLRNQGFVDSLDDFHTLGICHDFGDANVRLGRQIPEKLKPTLTSGCGAGITFAMPDKHINHEEATSTVSYPAEAVFTLMKELNQKAEQYRSHGGIHSAAVGDGERLLLFAEDIGRHNTLDRIAGEALFKGIDLAGKMLVTSGRVSTEMVAKAARLGIGLIASRTSPTDLAIRMSEAAGITLVGYLRGENFEVYSRPDRIAVPSAEDMIAGVSGVILAGGESRRMGSDKSLLPIHGARFIDHVHRTLATMFEDVVIVTNSPDLYSDIDCRKVPDIYYAQGSLAGIHSGICHAKHERAFVVACDMPFINPTVVRDICANAEQGEVVIPVHQEGFEPLHALYGKSCLAAMEEELDAGKKRIIGFFPKVKVSEITTTQWSEVDPEGFSFRNINTPEEYFELRDVAQLPSPKKAQGSQH
jgi:FdhD protein